MSPPERGSELHPLALNYPEHTPPRAILPVLPVPGSLAGERIPELRAEFCMQTTHLPGEGEIRDPSVRRTRGGPACPPAEGCQGPSGPGRLTGPRAVPAAGGRPAPATRGAAAPDASGQRRCAVAALPQPRGSPFRGRCGAAERGPWRPRPSSRPGAQAPRLRPLRAARDLATHWTAPRRRRWTSGGSVWGERPPPHESEGRGA